MAITLTEKAVGALKKIIDEQSGAHDLNKERVALRVGVKGGGCSGFSYNLDLTESDPENADAHEEFQQGGIKILCDPKSYLYLNGVEIDYHDDVMQRGFVFNNPNATSSCGCGSSFSA